MTARLIKQMQYADAWNENDVCALLSTYNHELGDFAFFKTLLEAAKKTKVISIINDDETMAYKLRMLRTPLEPAPLYNKISIQKWIASKGFKLPDELTEQPTDKSERHLERKVFQLQKLVIGMAMDKYKYAPGANRNTATGNNKDSIKAGLEKIGIKMDEETIKKYLEEAESAIS